MHIHVHVCVKCELEDGDVGMHEVVEPSASTVLQQSCSN